jgi:hypothetical protein
MFRDMILFRLQVLYCHQTDNFFFITVHLKSVTTVVWVAYLLFVIAVYSFQPIKQGICNTAAFLSNAFHRVFIVSSINSL